MKSVEKQFGKQHLQNSVLETENPKTQDAKPKTRDTEPETFKLGGPISFLWSPVSGLESCCFTSEIPQALMVVPDLRF